MCSFVGCIERTVHLEEFDNAKYNAHLREEFQGMLSRDIEMH
jgi:hypothetical protein